MAEIYLGKRSEYYFMCFNGLFGKQNNPNKVLSNYYIKSPYGPYMYNRGKKTAIYCNRCKDWHFYKYNCPKDEYPELKLSERFIN